MLLRWLLNSHIFRLVRTIRRKSNEFRPINITVWWNSSFFAKLSETNIYVGRPINNTVVDFRVSDENYKTTLSIAIRCLFDTWASGKKSDRELRAVTSENRDLLRTSVYDSLEEGNSSTHTCYMCFQGSGFTLFLLLLFRLMEKCRTSRPVNSPF